MPPKRLLPTWTSTPFLYPSLVERTTTSVLLRAACRAQTTTALTSDPHANLPPPITPSEHLNPPPTDYSRNVFTDRCTLTLHAGSGGHGCVSFLREKFVPNGPANGGDGGSGGNIYIQAVDGDTSLHKLARRGVLKAGRGRNGQGKGRGGERGEDLLLQVPVGTVVKETERYDPVALQEEQAESEEPIEGDQRGRWRRDKWIMYPSSLPSEFVTAAFPALPRPRRSNLTIAQPEPPISLDLSSPMTTPMLLAAGAVGGLGNPHFVTKSIWRPKFATRGEEGMSLTLELELKILADVGLVGFPNAGKSTLLRALSKSRTRVGSWAFTTLQPNIGTVVLDDHKGRPRLPSISGEPRTRFTVADIPGLIEDAHLGRGLGLGFLRHVERAKILVFVVDLSQGEAVQIVERLWSELKEYEALRESVVEEDNSEMVPWVPFGNDMPALEYRPQKPQIRFGPSPISAKPWCVIATKADLPETQENFALLQEHLAQKTHSPKSKEEAGKERARARKKATNWDGPVQAIPVSAINGHGMERVVDHIISLLDTQ